MASAELNKKIYGMGAVLGLVEHGSRNDELHCIVNRVTGKSSVGALTEYEAHKVISELKEYMKLSRLEENAPPPSNYSVMSEQQKKFGFRLLYRLINLDETPSEANARERMSGVIEKVIQKSRLRAETYFTVCPKLTARR